MKIKVSGKQLNLRQSLYDLAEEKLAKFDRFFGSDAEAEVSYTSRHAMQYVEITIYYGGTIFRAEEGADEFRDAFDRATDALERQMRKNKTRLQKRLRDGAFDAPGIEEEEEEKEFRIRTKSFPIKPMSVEEAILQMNLLEHQFFVFRDDTDGNPCVVYRRKDGDYGLIVAD